MEVGLNDDTQPIRVPEPKTGPIEDVLDVFKKTAQEADGKYDDQVRILGQQSLTFLDVVADKALDLNDSKAKSLLKQTGLGLIGIPGGYSVGDILGVLRGYRNLRQGNTVKGALELVTALLPGVPTPPIHAAIEAWVPDTKIPPTDKT